MDKVLPLGGLRGGINDMAPPTKLAHVVYMTRRFDEMLSWYQTVFEARVQYQNPAFAFLTYDNEHHRFAFVNMTVLRPDDAETGASSKSGVNHIGYTYATVGELLDTYDRLKQLGITPYWRIHHGVTLSMYFQDPDGNRMEFQVDCCANADEAHTYMHSDAFAANPIGVEVDFDSLLAQYRNGASTETLLAQPDGPPSPIPTRHGM
jgi:catechol-2,3-dioxygenase